MPVRSLALRNGEEVFAALLDAGLPFIELGHKRKLATYLMACQPERRITCVERTGWHGRAHVPPQGSIGPDADGAILQTAGYAANDFTERGSLSEWQQGLRGWRWAIAASAFALSLAFAAPLLSWSAWRRWLSPQGREHGRQDHHHEGRFQRLRQPGSLLSDVAGKLGNAIEG